MLRNFTVISSVKASEEYNEFLMGNNALKQNDS